MEIVRLECFRPSSCGRGEVFTRAVRPTRKEDIRACVQIAHGMSEHSLRYLEFAEYLAKQGYAVYANDHIGHGRSVGPAGYFGPQNGWESLLLDMRTLTDTCMRAEFKDAPVFLIGHSMGSILVREYMARWGATLNGAVLMGPPTPNTFAGFAKLICNAYVKSRGDDAPLPEFARMLDDNFSKKLNKSAESADSGKNAWISSDAAAVYEYNTDPMCGFPFTTSGYRELCAGLKAVSSSDWPKRVPKDLPVLVLGGSDDGAGNCGKAVRVISERLEAVGVKNVSAKLYKGARHDLLHEVNKHEVYEDIARFLSNCMECLQ